MLRYRYRVRYVCTYMYMIVCIGLLLVLPDGAFGASPTPLKGNLKDVVEDVVEGVRDLGEKGGKFLRDEVHRTFLAGNILPFLNKIWISPTEFKNMCKTLREVTDWQDILFLAVVAFATVPLLKLPYGRLVKQNRNSNNSFRDTTPHMVGDLVQQLSRLGLVCYLVDVIKVVLIEMGFGWRGIPLLPKVFARSIYTLWAARRLAKLKKWMLCKIWDRRTDSMGRMAVIDHLLDAVLMLIATLIVVDVLSVELGLAVKSIFAFGSVGTLVVSFASQGIVSNLMNGLLLSASDRVYEGDKVKFGKDISGTVVKMGWMETVVRGSDEVMLTVPNSDLASQRLSNLSRLRKCQVKQVLRFGYKDANKLTKLCDDIKEEIKTSCAELISDGTRPFRCHWVGYEEAHLQVVVEAHFAIRPIGDGYWMNRQKVLESINRAVEKNDVDFVI